MSSRCVIRLAAVWLLGNGVGAAAGPQADPSVPNQDESAVRSLIAAYAKSVDTVDTSLASTIWADTPDVSFIHPRGHDRGWPSIKVNLYDQVMGQSFSERSLTVKDVAIHCYGDTAWAEFYWDFAARFREDGRPLATHGRETQIYRKVGGTWRLVHVHYSGMPITGEREGF